MNEDAQRVAIAEACGWKLEWQNKFAKGDPSMELLHLFRPNGQIEIAGYFTREQFPGLRIQMARYVPDFLNDLNAMHSAVASQGEMFQVGFAGALNARAGMLGKWTHQLTPKDWADCFIVVLQSKRDDFVAAGRKNQ